MAKSDITVVAEAISADTEDIDTAAHGVSDAAARGESMQRGNARSEERQQLLNAHERLLKHIASTVSNSSENLSSNESPWASCEQRPTSSSVESPYPQSTMLCEVPALELETQDEDPMKTLKYQARKARIQAERIERAKKRVPDFRSSLSRVRPGHLRQVCFSDPCPVEHSKLEPGGFRSAPSALVGGNRPFPPFSKVSVPIFLTLSSRQTSYGSGFLDSATSIASSRSCISERWKVTGLEGCESEHRVWTPDSSAV